MIGRLTGKILEKTPPQLLLEVNGVGYEVEAPLSTFFNLPEVGTDISLRMHMIVREDAQLLYGFYSEAERSLFRALIKINGIGAKVALAILSGMQPEEFAICVESRDISSLTRIPGIGKKTAERLLVEIKDKLTDIISTSASLTKTSETGITIHNHSGDAVHALVALGYKTADAEKMVKKAYSAELSTEEIIRTALKSTTR